MDLGNLKANIEANKGASRPRTSNKTKEAIEMAPKAVFMWAMAAEVGIKGVDLNMKNISASFVILRGLLTGEFGKTTNSGVVRGNKELRLHLQTAGFSPDFKEINVAKLQKYLKASIEHFDVFQKKFTKAAKSSEFAWRYPIRESTDRAESEPRTFVDMKTVDGYKGLYEATFGTL